MGSFTPMQWQALCDAQGRTENALFTQIIAGTLKGVLISCRTMYNANHLKTRGPEWLLRFYMELQKLTKFVNKVQTPEIQFFCSNCTNKEDLYENLFKVNIVVVSEKTTTNLICVCCHLEGRRSSDAFRLWNIPTQFFFALLYTDDHCFCSPYFVLCQKQYIFSFN